MITMTPIVPGKFNAAAMQKQLLAGLETIGREIRDDFERTVDTWHNKPAFEPPSPKPVVSNNIATVETSTVDKVYRWVTKGTKAHPIVPVNGPLLIFPGVFSSKTVPGVIPARSGFSGPPMEYRGQEGVHHPGVEARRFDELIRDSQEKNAKNIMELAMLQAAQASGHEF